MKKNRAVEYISFFYDHADLFFWVIMYAKRIRLALLDSVSKEQLLDACRFWPFLKMYFLKNTVALDCPLKNNTGEWYDLSQRAITLTESFFNQNAATVLGRSCAFYNHTLKTKKFEAYVKKKIANHFFELLKFFYLVNRYGLKHKVILLPRNALNIFVADQAEKTFNATYDIQFINDNFDFGICSFIFYYLAIFSRFLRQGFVFNRRKVKYKISQQGNWGFSRRVLRDDILVDSQSIKKNDVLLFEITRSVRSEDIIARAKDEGFAMVTLSALKINVSPQFFREFGFYFFTPLWAIPLSFLKGYKFFGDWLLSFHRQAFFWEVLLWLYQFDFYMSRVDYDDVIPTIIMNKHAAKVAFFHWSDLAIYDIYSHAFCAHDIFFSWGRTHERQTRGAYINQKIQVGCILKKEINKISMQKNQIYASYPQLPSSKKVVLFCDTSFGNFEYTEDFFVEFIELINDFCSREKDVTVVLKSKNEESVVLQGLRKNRVRYQSLWRELFAAGNFVHFSPSDCGIEEMIAIADVCVSMSMNTTSTIALICGKEGLYYDLTNNREHPFAQKYRDSIVFSDREKLFRQIHNVLDGKFSCHEVIMEKELREFDAFEDDKALDRVRAVLCN